MKNPHNNFWRQYFNGALSQACDFLNALRGQRAAGQIAPEETKRFLDDPADAIHFNAPSRLRVEAGFFTSDRYLKQYDRADWQHVDLSLQLFAAKLIELCRKKGIPLYVHSAFRTKAQQNKHVADGTSNTPWPRASHCQGKAVDIVHSAYHWNMTPAEWSLLGKVGKELARNMGLKLTWGGDWDFYDPAHWELQGWKDDIRKLPDDGKKTKTPRKILAELKGYRPQRNGQSKTV